MSPDCIDIFSKFLIFIVIKLFVSDDLIVPMLDGDNILEIGFLCLTFSLQLDPHVLHPPFF